MFCNEKSVIGRRWEVREELPKSDIKIDDVLPTVVDIAVNRNVGDIENYFQPSFLESMPDPSTMVCMDEAIARVIQAITSDEKITVYGDYDVDGATSTSLLVRYFRMIGKQVDFYIPDRLKEGYGPNPIAIGTLADSGTSLFIIADSGSMANEAMDIAKEKGTDVIILDHHECNKTLPYGIIVNPKRPDENRKMEYLCAAGLVFLFITGLTRALKASGFLKESPDIKSLLGIVALGTVADVVPLVDLNRAYVTFGLRRLDQNIGIRALIKQTEIKGGVFKASHCGFILGPCINAAGRIGDCSLGVRLLTTDDEKVANEIAKQLVELNAERREIEKDAVDEACKITEDKYFKDNAIVIYNADWHPGVVGLVASRLRDRFGKSAVVFGTGGSGSARSMDGFDIGSCIIEASSTGLLLRGGGHKAAAGCTIDTDRIDEFREFINKKAEGFEADPISIDLVVDIEDLDKTYMDVMDSMKKMEPTGMGNAKPKTVVTGGIISRVDILKGKHIKAIIASEYKKIPLLIWNSVDTAIGESIVSNQGADIDILGTIEINDYNGYKSLQIMGTDVMVKNVNAA